MSRLRDKVAIVTGSGAGIGKAIAEEFAKEGAQVVCATRFPEEGKPVADAIAKEGGKAFFVKCDVSSEADVKAMTAAAIQKYGRIDVLVNNAGVNFGKPFEEVEVEDWDRILNVDLRGVFLCTRSAIPHMLQAKKGSVVNISSVHSIACVAQASAYDAAKWGVVGLTKALAVEYAARGIRFNALSPGLIATNIWKAVLDAAPSEQQAWDYWKSNIPTGRPGTPEEIAKVAVFLASDDASYVTGSNILADGGMTSLLISLQPYQSKAIEGK